MKTVFDTVFIIVMGMCYIAYSVVFFAILSGVIEQNRKMKNKKIGK